MSVGFAGLHLLLPALNSIPRSSGTRILLLGTQDFAFTYEQAEAFFSRHSVKYETVPISERRTTNSFAYVSQHEWWKYKDYLHQDTLFRMLGFQKCQVDTMDVSDYEHADLIHDLNEPLPDDIRRYDFILNQGTLEHIFDIKQALWNLSDLTSIGGQIVHMVPANFLGHGFYNFNANMFSDFYRQSHWDEEELFYTLVASSPDDGQDVYGRISPDKTSSAPSGFFMNIFARYRKTSAATKPIAVQRMYEDFHEASNIHDRAQAPVHNGNLASVTPWRSGLKRIKSGFKKARLTRKLRQIGATAIAVD